MGRKVNISKLKKLRNKGKTYAQIGRKYNKSSFWAFSLLNSVYRPKKYRGVK